MLLASLGLLVLSITIPVRVPRAPPRNVFGGGDDQRRRKGLFVLWVTGLALCFAGCLRARSHPRIVQFLGIAVGRPPHAPHEDHWLLVTELCDANLKTCQAAAC